MRLNMKFGELYLMPQKEVYDKGYSVGYEDALKSSSGEIDSDEISNGEIDALFEFEETHTQINTN